MKKVLGIVLAIALVFILAVPASACSPNTGEIDQVVDDIREAIEILREEIGLNALREAIEEFFAEVGTDDPFLEMLSQLSLPAMVIFMLLLLPF